MRGSKTDKVGAKDKVIAWTENRNRDLSFKASYVIHKTSAPPPQDYWGWEKQETNRRTSVMSKWLMVQKIEWKNNEFTYQEELVCDLHKPCVYSEVQSQEIWNMTLEWDSESEW